MSLLQKLSYTYDQWGVPTVTGNETIAALNPCSYRCYEYDEETGYYYLQSRYYNPENGRFLNADDTAFIGASNSFVSANIYAYCENKPIMMSDPDGHEAISISVAGVVLLVIVGYVFACLLTQIIIALIKLICMDVTYYLLNLNGRRINGLNFR